MNTFEILGLGQPFFLTFFRHLFPYSDKSLSPLIRSKVRNVPDSVATDVVLK